MSDTVELPEVTQEQYVALLDALRYTRENAATSIGQRVLDDVETEFIRFHDGLRDRELRGDSDE